MASYSCQFAVTTWPCYSMAVNGATARMHRTSNNTHNTPEIGSPWYIKHQKPIVAFWGPKFLVVAKCHGPACAKRFCWWNATGHVPRDVTDMAT